MKNTQIKDNSSSIDDIRSRLRDIEGSNAALEELEYEEGKVAKEIDSIQESGALEKYESDIKRLTAEIGQFDSQITEATDDFELLSKDKGILDQIEIYTNQKNQKKAECRKMCVCCLNRSFYIFSFYLGSLYEFIYLVYN